MEAAVSSTGRRKNNDAPDVWGYGSFENEAAMRWVERLEEAIDLELLEATFDEALELEDAGEPLDMAVSSTTIAAAETVAALAGAPSSDLPEEVRQWCFDNPELELGEVQAKAVQALGVVLAGSRLRDLFEEHDKAEEWEVDVEDLRDRLRG
ncbi:MAG TPA: DUF4259 domain-containing protein [Sandaracinaceae bacterium LLY-WYZ-13_1]|nr:DUF4259 domain-containing protein [Sandaracinaceae bacterium LLY-WYZ-13_1]